MKISITVTVFLMLLVAPVFAQTIQESSVSRTAEKQLVGDLAISGKDNFRLRNPVELKISFTNKTKRPFEIRTMNAYSDCRLELYDADGKPCKITDFGLSNLDPRVFFGSTKSPTQMEEKYGRFSGISIFAGSSIETTVKPGASHTWMVDMNKCYHLKPGKYVLKVSCPRSKSIQASEQKFSVFE